jgi:hypothetical protein
MSKVLCCQKYFAVKSTLMSKVLCCYRAPCDIDRGGPHEVNQTRRIVHQSPAQRSTVTDIELLRSAAMHFERRRFELQSVMMTTGNHIHVQSQELDRDTALQNLESALKTVC